MRHAVLLTSVLFILMSSGCKSDSRPVPRTYRGDTLYEDYRKQPRGVAMTPAEANAVLVRTDLKTTGDYSPPDLELAKTHRYRFIYGGKYYYVYESGPRATKEMYGPFELP